MGDCELGRQTANSYYASPSGHSASHSFMISRDIQTGGTCQKKKGVGRVSTVQSLHFALPVDAGQKTLYKSSGLFDWARSVIK